MHFASLHFVGVSLAKVLERLKSVCTKGVLWSVGELGVWVYTGLYIHSYFRVPLVVFDHAHDLVCMLPDAVPSGVSSFLFSLFFFQAWALRYFFCICSSLACWLQRLRPSAFWMFELLSQFAHSWHLFAFSHCARNYVLLPPPSWFVLYWKLCCTTCSTALVVKTLGHPLCGRIGRGASREKAGWRAVNGASDFSNALFMEMFSVCVAVMPYNSRFLLIACRSASFS